LRQLNPRTRFPTEGLSPPLLRAERNAATTLVTTWLASSSDALAFQAGNDRFGVPSSTAFRSVVYPRPLFENVGQSTQFLPRTGQRAVALRMFYGVRPRGTNRQSPSETGFIGIVDLPTARRFGLPTARLINAAGVAVAPTDESILAGYRAMKPDPHDATVRIADVASPDPAAYPLVMVDYAMVPKQARTTTMASNYRRVLEFAAGDGQSQLPPGYVPLPIELRNQTRQVAAGIGVVPSTPATTTPTTTSPPGSTTTTTTVPSAATVPSTTVPLDVGTSTTTTVSPPATNTNTFDPNFTGGFVPSGGGGGTSGGVVDGFDDVGEPTGEDVGDAGAVDGDEQGGSEIGEESPVPVVDDVLEPGLDSAAPAAAPLRPLPESRSTLILPLLQVLAGSALVAWAAMQAPAAWRAARRQLARWRRRAVPAGASS
jgi:hypothetical protein